MLHRVPSRSPSGGPPPETHDLLKRVVLGALAAIVAISAGMFAVAAGRGFSLDRILTGEPLTVTAALGLFGLVFVVVGAGAAVRWLMVMAMRKKGSQAE